MLVTILMNFVEPSIEVAKLKEDGGKKVDIYDGYYIGIYDNKYVYFYIQFRALSPDSTPIRVELDKEKFQEKY